MDNSSPKNGILRCVRCESKDEIKQYYHKTPDKQIVKTTKHFTKITTFPDTGGSGYVPVCSRCTKLFFYGKLTFSLMITFLVISFLVFMFLLLIIITGVTPFSSEFNSHPTNSDYILLMSSGVIALILLVGSLAVKASSINPHKVINIMRNRIYIKPLKASGWRLCSSPGIQNTISQRKMVEYIFPDRCPHCKTEVIKTDEERILCPKCHNIIRRTKLKNIL